MRNIALATALVAALALPCTPASANGSGVNAAGAIFFGLVAAGTIAIIANSGHHHGHRPPAYYYGQPSPGYYYGQPGGYYATPGYSQPYGYGYRRPGW